jgi:hypothetical protein
MRPPPGYLKTRNSPEEKLASMRAIEPQNPCLPPFSRSISSTRELFAQRVRRWLRNRRNCRRKIPLDWVEAVSDPEGMDMAPSVPAARSGSFASDEVEIAGDSFLGGAHFRRRQGNGCWRFLKTVQCTGKMGVALDLF